jgi:hypothetical protein
MAMTNQNHPLAAPVTANQNLQHVELAIVTQNHLPVEQEKVTVNLRLQPVVPHAEREASKEFYVPGTLLTGTGNFLNSTQNNGILCFSMAHYRQLRPALPALLYLFRKQSYNTERDVLD